MSESKRIGRWEYRELVAFCRQYPDKLHKRDAGSKADCALIRRVAEETRGGSWTRALILNVCQGIAYEYIEPTWMPTSHRNTFFAVRREFFWRLRNARKEQGDTNAAYHKT